ncbi:MAG: hypothetical protein HPY69_06900 [Armatimonadetes bacterium]|nr:hypothetical protein [Armatimonadota bacterium]
MPEHNSKSVSRRGFLARLLGVGGAALLGVRALAQQVLPGWSFRGEPLTTHVRKGEPPVQPLDTMLLFERGDDNNDRAMTHEVLSLIHEEKGRNSYPWTMYASLDTHHEVGDACVVCSRLHKHGPGWSTGLHSEVFNHGRMVALGVNIEMSNDYDGPDPTKVIGLNIQAVGGPRPMQYGIQVHDGQGRFETGIGLNGAGQVGLDIAGDYETGVHTHDNDIRLNEGACVVLDGEGRIRLRYRSGRIEFLNGDRCFAHLDVDAEDHAL